MSELNPEAVPTRDGDTIWREVEEEIFICSADGETMFTLSDVAADIWRVCDGEHTVAEITELMLAAYEVDRETMTRDLAEYLADLEAKGLVFFN